MTIRNNLRAADEAAYFARLTMLNGLVAGWALLVLGLLLNFADLVGPGGDRLAGFGIVCSGLAIFCVWAGMLCTSAIMRGAWFAWNVIAVVMSLGLWLLNHSDLWGISHVLS